MTGPQYSVQSAEIPCPMDSTHPSIPDEAPAFLAAAVPPCSCCGLFDTFLNAILKLTCLFLLLMSSISTPVLALERSLMASSSRSWRWRLHGGFRFEI